MTVGKLSDRKKNVIVGILAAPIEYGHGSRWQKTWIAWQAMKSGVSAQITQGLT